MTQAPRTFAAQLRHLRTQLDLTQEALAAALGVSFATVNRWEQGHREPSPLARKQLDAFIEKMVKAGKLSQR